MRILIVTQYFWPENFRINDLVRELQSRGHDLTVLTGKPNYPSGTVFPDFRADPARFASFEGVEVIRVPMMPRARGSLRLILNYLTFVLGAVSFGIFKLRARSFDLVFIYEPSPITVAIPAILIGRLKKIPVVFWVLDLWPETLAALGVVRSKQVLSLIGRGVRVIYDNCTLVLGQSRSFVPSISRYCSDPTKVRYYPSWAEQMFVSDGVKKAPEVPEVSDAFTIVFAGNIGESQDMPTLLRAAECLKEDTRVRWVFVGDGRKFHWVRAEVESRGLSDNVLLVGRHPIERMPSFYAHADALLVSLKSDPVFSLVIPAKLQTYLMSGIPILGMLDGEGAQVIRDSGAGLSCPAGDSEALVTCILDLMASSVEERAEMGRLGRQYASAEFDRDTLISRLEGFFSEARIRFRRFGT
ncbi:MAG: glycosyltransferase family 4 protein [Gammaproteobacteria bacterium]|nr:glycosyltransferase family 4 protein [Gammaproteobacteria bacterium]